MKLSNKFYHLLVVFLVIVYLVTAGVTIYSQLHPRYVVPDFYICPYKDVIPSA